MLFGLFSDNKLRFEVTKEFENCKFGHSELKNKNTIQKIFQQMEWTQNARWDFLGLDTYFKTRKIKFVIKQVVANKKIETLSKIINSPLERTSDSIQTRYPFFKEYECALIATTKRKEHEHSHYTDWKIAKQTLLKKQFAESYPSLQICLSATKEEIHQVEKFLNGKGKRPNQKLLKALCAIEQKVLENPRLAKFLPEKLDRFLRSFDFFTARHLAMLASI